MSKVLIDDEDIIVPEKVETVPHTEPKKNYGPLVWAIVALVLVILAFYLYNYIQKEKNGNI